MRTETKYKAVGGIDVAVTQFDFPRAAPGMADLMRRLYQIRIDCGAIKVDRDEQEMKEEQMKNLRKMDAFERHKVEMSNLLDETRSVCIS